MVEDARHIEAEYGRRIRQQQEDELEELKVFAAELGYVVFDVVQAIQDGDRQQTRELFVKGADLLFTYAER